MTWLIRIAMVLTVAAASVGWVAAGELGASSSAGLRRTGDELGQGIDLAEATAAVADQLQQSVATLSTGMGSAAEAIGHTVEVSANVRALLDYVSVLGKVEDLNNSLATAEASLLETQGGLNETKDDLIAAGPKIDDAVKVLHAVPDRLRDAQRRIASAAARVDRQVGLWRAVLIMGALALLLLMFVVDRLAWQLRRLPAV